MIKNKKKWRKYEKKRKQFKNNVKKWKVTNLDSAWSVLLLDLIDFNLYEILF